MIPAYPEMMDKEDMKSMIRRKEFDQELEELRTLLKQMGEHVGAALDGAIESLQTMNAEKAQVIIKNDANLNALKTKLWNLAPN